MQKTESKFHQENAPIFGPKKNSMLLLHHSKELMEDPINYNCCSIPNYTP